MFLSYILVAFESCVKYYLYRGEKTVIKKILLIIALTVLCFLLTGCALHDNDDNPTLDINENAAYEGKFYNNNDYDDEDSFLFTWMTYSEIRVTDTLKNKTAYEKYIGGLLKNMKKIGVTDCFVQVRPFADAMYPSEYYPLSIYADKAKNFDPFSVIVSLGESYNIKIHAWINPYRISSRPLSEDSEFFSWQEENNGDIISTSSGVYFNPSSLKVQSLILSGVGELLKKYNIKGIHIDDYFYPSDLNDEDKAQYEVYRKNGGMLDISQWRRENVNALVSAMYLKVKSFGGDKLFSVSPAGNIDKNYSQLYADVGLWCKGGYCDMVLPQIYFGFQNDSLPFEKCFDDWLNITDSEKVILIPGLALYKVGNEDMFAGSGKDEWINNNDIISRQVQLIKEKGSEGYALYSSSYINFSEKFTAQELKNLQNML